MIASPPSARNTLQAQMEAASQLGSRSVAWFRAQAAWKKAACVLALAVALAATILGLVFHHRVIGTMVRASDYIKTSRFGGAALFAAIFFVGFPPLLGFSALSMLCGMVYGFPGGWPVLAAASISGSFVSFLVFRYFLRNQAERLVARNERFRAFAEILKEDASLFLLVLLRLCPLPYSLSNGALAAIPNLPATTYLVASLITSPKLFMHVFIGHTIKNLGDDGRPAAAKILDVFSILLTGCAVSSASFIIYHRMQRKLESYHEDSAHGHAHAGNYDDLVFGAFDDDDDSGNNLELNSTEFDDDNFIIADDDDHDDQVMTEATGNSNERDLGFSQGDDPLDTKSARQYRDY